MKNIITLFISFLFLININAQLDFDVKWGEKKKIKDGYFKSFLYDGDNQSIVLSSKSNAYFFDLYNQEMLFEGRYKLEMPVVNNIETLFYNVYVVDEELVLITNFHDVKNKLSYLFATKIDNKGFFLSETITLCESETDGNTVGVAYIAGLSDDKSLICVFFTVEDNSKLTNLLYNSNIELVREKTFNFFLGKEEIGFEAYEFDSEGNIYVLISYKGENDSKVYKLYSYSAKTNKKSNKKINITYGNIENINFFRKNNQLIVTGYYSLDNKKGFDGIFYDVYDKNSGNKISTSSFEFDNDFRIEVMGEKDFEKGRTISKHWFKDIIKTETGEVFLISQKDYYVNFKSTTDYFYEKIILSKISTSGEIEFVSVVHNNARGGFPSYYGYNYLYDENSKELKLIINDSPKNIELAKMNEKLKRIKDVKNTIVSCVTIDKHGEVTREALLVDSGININCYNSVNLSNSTILIYGRRSSKEYCIGKISLK